MITDLINLSKMPNKDLVALYNRHSPRKVLRFSDRATAIRRCADLLLEVSAAPPKPLERPRMKDSLKLDRTIRCEQNGRLLGVFKNAHQMWKQHPDLLSSGQQDRLTKQLYAAAKQGVRLVVTINERQFSLVNVGSKQ